MRLNALEPELNRRFVAGAPAKVEGYRVYPVLGVIANRWENYPALSNPQADGDIEVVLSVQAAVVDEILSVTTDLMSHQEPPGRDFIIRQGMDLLRRALSDFIRRLVFVHGNWEGMELVDALNDLAAQPYEGRTGIGTILLCKPDDPHIEVEIGLVNGVDPKRTRSFRKALEMTGPNLALLTDGASVFGLGRMSSTYDLQLEAIYSIRVVGRGSWELHHGATALVRVDNGNPSLPRPRIDKAKFVDTVDRIFGASSDSEMLWELTTAATRQQHGTMVVVHRDASGEAARLAPQALAVDPVYLDSSSLEAVTSIDGAVLVDPAAKCHAVGVILDGVAVTGLGDQARGARYNSAVRYHQGSESGACLIVIVSEDGMINLIPDLRRRVARDEVERAVTALVESSTARPLDFKRASSKSKHVESLAFYLSDEQCARVNEARLRIEDERERLALASKAPSITRVGFAKVSPNPEMNDSYFLEAAMRR
ncbi:hypothetical protein A0130_10020 [Leifsonia xyli]|nr:hypothetical protein A0130_10020 [Leifsonia xyli]